jgi:hypothetical protein
MKFTGSLSDPVERRVSALRHLGLSGIGLFQ